MSILEERFKCLTTPDFELGLEHQLREVSYFLASPKTPSKGLVVYIPGFGADLGEYPNVFCRKIAEKYSLSAMTVEYHSICSRPDSGATMLYEKQDILLIEKLCLQYGVSLNGSSSIEAALESLNNHLASQDNSATVTAVLNPGKNEYQNGGVLSALDIINAVGDVLKRVDIPTDNIILVGSSYGGYLANLASKLAPQTFRAVFDNSSWAHPNLVYIVGRELGQPEVVVGTHSHIRTNCNLKSAWTLVSGLPNTLDESRFSIRDFSEGEIVQMAKFSPDTFYYFIHGPNDPIANTEEKITMAQEMAKNGMDVYMEVVDKDDVDGRYIKTTDHGLGLSMLTFFDKGYSHISQYTASGSTDFSKQNTIKYQTTQFNYVFDYKNLPVLAQVKRLV